MELRPILTGHVGIFGLFNSSAPIGADSPPNDIIIAGGGSGASLEEGDILRMVNMRKTDISRILVGPVDYLRRICGELSETRNSYKRHHYVGKRPAPILNLFNHMGEFCTGVAHFSQCRAHLFRGIGY